MEKNKEGCRGSITEDRISRCIKMLKKKAAYFPWHFDTDSIKKTAGVFPACSRDNANPCPLTGQDLQGEADAER